MTCSHFRIRRTVVFEGIGDDAKEKEVYDLVECVYDETGELAGVYGPITPMAENLEELYDLLEAIGMSFGQEPIEEEDIDIIETH